MQTRYSSEEIRRAWAKLIAMHISVGPPSFDFFRHAIASGEVSEVDVRDGLDTDWASVQHSAVGGFTEVQGLRALELVLDVEWSERRTDLVLLHDRLSRGVAE